MLMADLRRLPLEKQGGVVMCHGASTPEKFASRALFKALWSGRWTIHPDHKIMDLRWYDALYLCLRDHERVRMHRRMWYMLQGSLAGEGASM